MAPHEVPGYECVEAVPAAADPAYDRVMLELISRHQPDLVVPTVADELPRMAVLSAASGLGSQVVLSAPGPAAISSDKLLTMWALARQGLAVPRYAGADEFSSAADALSFIGGPLVVKPRVARGGRGVHVVEDPHDPVWERLDGSWIVQAFASGTEYSPQVYRSPVSGRTTVVVLEKTGRKEGRVGNATAVARLPSSEAPDVAAVAEKVAQGLDLVGPIDMDVRRMADGTPVVLEVNCRFGAVSAHAPELLDHVLADWPR